MVAPGPVQGRAGANRLASAFQDIFKSYKWQVTDWQHRTAWEMQCDEMLDGENLTTFVEMMKGRPAPVMPGARADWRDVASSPYQHCVKQDPEGQAALREACLEYQNKNAAVCSIVRATIDYDPETDDGMKITTYIKQKDGLGLLSFIRKIIPGLIVPG